MANYDGTKLAADLAGASSSYFKQAAAGLRKRGDYDVAQEYLKEYDAGRQSLGNPSNQGFDWDFLRLAAKISSLRAERRTRVDPLEAAGQLSQVMRELSDKAEGAGLVNPAGSGNRLDNPGLGVSAPVRLLQADLAAQLARVCVQHHGEIAERLSSGNGMESGSGNGTESWAGFSSGQAIVGNLGAAFRGYSDAVSILDGEGGRPSGNSGAVPSGTDATAEREARRQSKASLKFARFCNDVLQLASGDADQTQNNPPSLPPEIASALAGGTDSGLPPVSNYPPLVIKHVLRALSLDASLKPHQLIPRVLALLGQNKATLKEFEAGVEAVPSWVFIAWVSQILSVMEQPEGRVLARVLERVAEDFPQALYYPFNGEAL